MDNNFLVERYTAYVNSTTMAGNVARTTAVKDDGNSFGTLLKQKIESIEGVGKVEIELVFEPVWDRDMMTEEAKLELGFL